MAEKLAKNMRPVNSKKTIYLNSFNFIAINIKNTFSIINIPRYYASTISSVPMMWNKNTIVVSTQDGPISYNIKARSRMWMIGLKTEYPLFSPVARTGLRMKFSPYFRSDWKVDSFQSKGISIRAPKLILIQSLFQSSPPKAIVDYLYSNYFCLFSLYPLARTCL